MLARGGWQLACAAALTSVAYAPSVRAQHARDDASDRYSVSARSETYLLLYRRALLPGPNGAIVETETAAPLYEYVSLRIDDLDSPWGSDDTDIELTAWGNSQFSDINAERRIDGDVQAANVRVRGERTWLKLGRQVWAGGAARYARFDGAALGGRTEVGIGGEAYGGLTVLPRWNGRRGYHQLGAAADTLLETPAALPDPKREDNWLAGGRLFYARDRIDAGVSFHEQHRDGGLGRRNLGADVRATPLDELALGGNANLDLDSTELIDGRVWGDVDLGDVDVGGEYLHAKPALYLSRQSVLSVFGSDGYDEVGANVSYQALDALRLWWRGYGERYSDGDVGSRTEVGARVTPDRWRWTVVRVATARVFAPENGYFSLRNSVRQRLRRDLVLTGESYLYFYDDPIARVTTSSVYAGSLEWWARDRLRILWGASLARSPYARNDAQTMLRLVYGIDREEEP